MASQAALVRQDGLSPKLAPVTHLGFRLKPWGLLCLHECAQGTRSSMLNHAVAFKVKRFRVAVKELCNEGTIPIIW